MPAVVPGTESFTPDAERSELEALVASGGWLIFERAMQERWNAKSYEREIRQITEETRVGEDVTGLIRQINATYEGMRKMLSWPAERIASLRSTQRAGQDRFAPLRRGWRPR